MLLKHAHVVLVICHHISFTIGEEHRLPDRGQHRFAHCALYFSEALMLRTLVFASAECAFSAHLYLLGCSGIYATPGWGGCQ